MTRNVVKLNEFLSFLNKAKEAHNPQNIHNKPKEISEEVKGVFGYYAGL